VTDDIKDEARAVLDERLAWAHALRFAELVRHGAHEMACEVLGPLSNRKYAHETNFLGDSPVHVAVDVFAYDPSGGWSDVLARGQLVAHANGITEG
jgi:hypothetical protein